MARFLPAVSVLAGLSLTGFALYPVLARDLEGFEITDPLDLVLPAEPVSAVETEVPSVDLPAEVETEPDTAIAEPETLAPALPPVPPKPVGPVVVSTHSGEALSLIHISEPTRRS